MRAYNRKSKPKNAIKSIKQIVKKHKKYINQACNDMQEYFKTS